MKHLICLLSLLFITCTSFHSTSLPETSAESKKLARQMSNLLGVKIAPSQANIYPVHKLKRWIGIPSFLLKKMKTGEYKKFIFVEFRFYEKVKEVTLKVPNRLREKYGADFIIAVNLDGKDWDVIQPMHPCTAKRCGLDGKCITDRIFVEGPDKCVDTCTSSGDCQQPCFVGLCKNGACIPSLVYTHDCGGVPDKCLSYEDCPKSGTDSSCEQKVCMYGICWEISFEIDSSEGDCPGDECGSDGDCITDLEGEQGILDGIKTVYGF